MHWNDNVLRYTELLRLIRGVTPKMLMHALKELQEDGLITRTVYPVVPPRVEYSLTSQAEKLVPFILYLSDWAKSSYRLNSACLMKPKATNEHGDSTLRFALPIPLTFNCIGKGIGPITPNIIFDRIVVDIKHIPFPD
ncbi:winged helix-turn-helix transcriptional regulator [Arcticibacter sp. MXS-1]|uniref:winged helix-turn-helix transcriptional regulator n=1 Tax=Arcticibacter sp. MXS-1 TaxID=3341726 RepID=UPI0035A8A82D